MVKDLYVFPAQYYNRNVYVYGLSFDSMRVFQDLVMGDVKVNGFVSGDTRFISDKVFGLPIFMEDALFDVIDSNDLIIAPHNFKYRNAYDTYKKNKISIIAKKEINPQLIGKKIYIYGDGNGKDILLRELDDDKFNVSGIITSEKIKKDRYSNIKKSIYADTVIHSSDKIIVSVLDEDFREQILKTLETCPCDVYVRDVKCKGGKNFVTIIEKGLKENREIFLAGRYSYFLVKLKKILSTYGIHISGVVNTEEDPEHDINDIYSLFGRCIEKTIIILAEPSDRHKCRLLQSIQDLGYRLEDMNIGGIDCKETLSQEMLSGINGYVKDPLLGETHFWGNEPLTGWKQIGKGGKRIMITGGSTTAYGLYRSGCWCEMLYMKLMERGISCEIFDGARAGENIVSEFLRIIRDMHSLKPDIVISLSGYNNIKPICNQAGFNLYDKYVGLKSEGGVFCKGVPVTESYFEVWRRFIGMTKEFVEGNNARFYAFLQPIDLNIPGETLENRLIFHLEGREEATADFYRKSTTDDIYINMIDMFHGKDGMHIDCCHYSRQALDIIADEVLNTILQDL